MGFSEFRSLFSIEDTDFRVYPLGDSNWLGSVKIGEFLDRPSLDWNRYRCVCWVAVWYWIDDGENGRHPRSLNMEFEMSKYFEYLRDKKISILGI